MSGGQSASGVTMRTDLRELMNEFDFAQDQSLANEIILPTISVDEAAAYYPVLPREEMIRVPDTNRAPDGTYPRDQWEWSSSNYTTKEYGFEEPIDLSQAAKNSSWVDEEEVAAQLATQKLLLSRESRVAAAVFNSTTFTGATNTGAITNEWDDSSNATCFADVEAAYAVLRGKCGLSKSMCSLIISDDNIRYFLRCTEVINSIVYTEAIASMAWARKLQFMADYLGIKEVVPVYSLYETSKFGATTPAIGKLWSNEYAMLAILSPATQSWRTRGLGRQPAFRKVTDSYIIEDYTEPNANRMIIRAREYRGTVINTEYGYLMSNMKTTVSSTTGV